MRRVKKKSIKWSKVVEILLKFSHQWTLSHLKDLEDLEDVENFIHKMKLRINIYGKDYSHQNKCTNVRKFEKFYFFNLSMC